MVEFGCICKVVEAPGKVGVGWGVRGGESRMGREGQVVASEVKYRVKVRRDGAGRGLRVEEPVTTGERGERDQERRQRSTGLKRERLEGK